MEKPFEEISPSLEKPVIGIMQPYYFPYEGYFSYIFNCSQFVLHDSIEYTKKGWINRNRVLGQSGILNLSLALRGSKDSSLISEKEISDSYDPQRQFRILEGAYRKSQFWYELKEILPELLQVSEKSMFQHLKRQIRFLSEIFDIPTNITTASEHGSFDRLRGQGLVIGISKALGAKTYLNPVGGKNLYSAADFN